jgi:hypothetical protein
MYEEHDPEEAWEARHGVRPGKHRQISMQAKWIS